MDNQYKQRIQELHNNLVKSGTVEIHSFGFYPPLTKDESKRLGNEFKLPEQLVSFYEEFNGCQLSYTYLINEDFNKSEFGYYESLFPPLWPNENYWHLDGCINILPLDFMLRNSWKNYIWFDSDQRNEIQFKGQSVVEQQIEKQLKPFDVFSKTSIGAILIQPDCDILLSTDHNSSYTDFLPLSLEKYFDTIIQNHGNIEKRAENFIMK